MSGNRLLVGENTAEVKKILEENELRATLLWYGPRSPLGYTEENDEIALYQHIFFPTKL